MRRTYRARPAGSAGGTAQPHRGGTRRPFFPSFRRSFSRSAAEIRSRESSDSQNDVANARAEDFSLETEWREEKLSSPGLRGDGVGEVRLEVRLAVVLHVPLPFDPRSGGGVRSSTCESSGTEARAFFGLREDSAVREEDRARRGTVSRGGRAAPSSVGGMPRRRGSRLPAPAFSFPSRGAAPR